MNDNEDNQKPEPETEEPVSADTAPSVEGIKTATIVLGLSKESTLIRTGVTPAEAQILVVMHATNYGGNPIVKLTETEPVARTRTQELSRLRRLFGTGAVKALYGPNSQLPATFRDAIESGIAWTSEQGALEERPLVGRRPTVEEAAAFK